MSTLSGISDASPAGERNTTFGAFLKPQKSVLDKVKEAAGLASDKTRAAADAQAKAADAANWESPEESAKSYAEAAYDVGTHSLT